MISESVAGERRAGPNVQTDNRSGSYSELIVNDVGFGKFFEATKLGRTFMIASAVGATLNGATNPLGAGGTALVAINNPVNNNKAAVIIKAFCSVICAATATPVLPVWNYIPAPTGITAAGSAGAISMQLNTMQSSMKTFVAAALTGSVAATFLRPFMGSFNDPRHAGTTSETSAGVLVEETDGTIIVPPGVCLIANTAPAGAAVTGCIGFTWVEIDWPL